MLDDRRLGIGISLASLLGIVIIAVILALRGPSIAPSSATEVPHAAAQEWTCTVTLSAATTLTAVGGKCAAPGVGQSLYIVDIVSGAQAAGSTTDSYNTLKYGTGGSCGTGTTSFYGALTNATIETYSDHFQIPIKIPANNEICWVNTTNGNKFWIITGYTAP